MPTNPPASVSKPTKILLVLLVLLVSLLVFVAASLGAVVVVCVAFAVGKVLVHLLPFTIFEATLLALLGLVVFATAVVKTIESFAKVPAPAEESEEEFADDDVPEAPTPKRVFVIQPAPSSAPTDAGPRRSRRPYRKN